MLVGMGNPLGTQNPHEYGFGQNFISVIGMSFLAGVFFLRGYGFRQVISSEFLPIAISNPYYSVAFHLGRHLTLGSRDPSFWSLRCEAISLTWLWPGPSLRICRVCDRSGPPRFVGPPVYSAYIQIHIHYR
jgi:hypothetical protein